MTFAVALGVTAIVATPAHAAPTDLAIAASGNADLTVGGTGQRLTFTIANRGPGDAENLTVRIDVPLGGEGVHINYGPDGCEVGRSNLRCGIDRLKRGESEQIMIRIAPPPNGGPATGDSRSGQGQARVEFGEELNPGNNAAAFNVTLRGPEAQALTSVSGTVKDSESDKPISNARVVVTDAKGNIRKTATNENGQFILRSGDTNPIAAGTIKISVGKDGYDTRTFSRTASAGASVRIPVRLTKKADPNASASAASGESEAAAVPTATGDTGSESGGGFMIWVLYLLAALLVLGGIGAIVWLFVRRKEDEDSERFGGAGPHGPPGHGPPGPHGPYGPQPIGAQGIYHDPYGQPTAMMGGAQATQMLGPAGSPTAVLGPGGMGPGGIASAGMGAGGLDQPTSMLPRPGLDQPTSLIGRTGLDEPTQAHPGPSAADDDVYPQGREHYARGTGGPGYGDPGYGRDRYGDPGPVSPGYSQGGSGYGSGYGQGGGHGQGGGYPQDQGYGDPGPVSPGYGQGPGQSPGQGYGEQQPRRGRRSAEDRRIDWYED